METKRFTHLPCRVPLTLAYPKTEALVTGCGGPGRTEAVRSQWLIYVARFAGTWGMGGGRGAAVGLKEGVQDLEDGSQPALWGSKELPPPRPPPLLPPTPWASHSVCLALYPTLGSARPS